MRLEDAALYRDVAKAIADGRVVGWFQGGMEFGPRALGDRSIVADPRRADMKEILNTRIKHRETYRPFAPSVLEEKVGEIFERSEPSPFMTMVYKVREAARALIPAVTHVDDTGRLQTVSARRPTRAITRSSASSSGRPACRWCSTPASTSTSRSWPRPPTPSPATSRPGWTSWRSETGC